LGLLRRTTGHHIFVSAAEKRRGEFAESPLWGGRGACRCHLLIAGSLGKLGKDQFNSYQQQISPFHSCSLRFVTAIHYEVSLLLNQIRSDICIYCCDGLCFRGCHSKFPDPISCLFTQLIMSSMTSRDSTKLVSNLLCKASEVIIDKLGILLCFFVNLTVVWALVIYSLAVLICECYTYLHSTKSSLYPLQNHTET